MIVQNSFIGLLAVHIAAWIGFVTDVILTCKFDGLVRVWHASHRGRYFSFVCVCVCILICYCKFWASIYLFSFFLYIHFGNVCITWTVDDLLFTVLCMNAIFRIALQS